MNHMPLNQDILRFWSHAAAHFGPASILKRVPKFIQELPPANDIVRRCAFVGLNPSFVAGPPDDQLNAWLIEHPALAHYPDVFCWNNPYNDWQNGANNYQQVQEVVEAMAQLHQEVRQWYPWFFRLNTLAGAMNDYIHLDIYLWLTGNADALPRRRAFRALFTRQECLFLELLDRIHPQHALCMYANVGDKIRQLCAQNVMGFLLVDDWVELENVPLSKANIVRLGNPNPITVFKPRRTHIPHIGRNPMPEQDFQEVCAFFQNL
jgi:hypothetical protein